MKIVSLFLVVFLTACTFQDFTKAVIEGASDSHTANGTMSCSNLQNSCPTRDYSEWENDDGTVGCVCNNYSERYEN